ncbi:arginase [Phytophthora nicotianae INRA-310]|uniref:Arginase n=1 Tax=Phytophthora nicotianae (strain INRA-310) TaxID=761204 RepID=W2R4F6_PHYN3|nr:arginase [Phytophthora nicotianae INRA-310]ETN19390.1 arginase [Phytophthora nicotianae INRA-310]
MLRRASSSLLRRVQQRGISSSSSRQWDQVRPHFHAGAHGNPKLNLPQTVSIIGAPMTYGQPLLGTDSGPDQLREAGLHKTLVGLGWSVEENGNLSFVAPSSNDPVLDPRYGKAKQCFPGEKIFFYALFLRRIDIFCEVGNGTKQLYEIFKQKSGEGKFCLVLGGDHTIGAGSLAGLLSVHPDAGVIWVDAHADINTPADSDSGNMHGMPIAFLMDGMVDSSKVPGFEWLVNGPTMKPEQLVYVGLRDVDTFERRVIHEKGIKAFSMQEVDRYGIGKTMEMALDHLCGKKQRPLHMSYDIDAVDPLVAPSTGTRVRGGLTWREAHYVAEAVAETNLMVGLDMVEVNPMLAPGNGAQITVDMALMLISSALGNRIL